MKFISLSSYYCFFIVLLLFLSLASVGKKNVEEKLDEGIKTAKFQNVLQ